MADPVIGLMELLEDNWVAANVSSITPVFSTGWYDSKQKLPQVTLTDPTDTPQSTGNAPFFGLVTNGVPPQYFVDSIACNVWVTRAGVAINPKKARYEIKEEIKRILQDEYDQVSGLDYVGWNGGIGVVDPDISPPVFRYIGEVGFSYGNFSA